MCIYSLVCCLYKSFSFSTCSMYKVNSLEFYYIANLKKSTELCRIGCSHQETIHYVLLRVGMMDVILVVQFERPQLIQCIHASSGANFVALLPGLVHDEPHVHNQTLLWKKTVTKHMHTLYSMMKFSLRFNMKKC